jgi:hypothetical protein
MIWYSLDTREPVEVAPNAPLDLLYNLRLVRVLPPPNPTPGWFSAVTRRDPKDFFPGSRYLAATDEILSTESGS